MKYKYTVPATSHYEMAYRRGILGNMKIDNEDFDIREFDDSGELIGVEEPEVLEFKVNHFFVDLLDKNVGIMPEPEKGYYAFLADISPEEKYIVSYKPAVENPDCYFKKAFEDAFEYLGNKNKNTIYKRYGLDTGNRMSLDDVGDTFSVSRETVRHWEENTLKRFMRPGRKNNLHELMCFEQKLENVGHEYQSEYGKLYEELIRGEIREYIEFGAARTEKIVFNRILASPRFHNPYVSYSSKPIEKLKLSKETCTCLRRAKIRTFGELRELTFGDIFGDIIGEKIDNLNEESIDEILKASQREENYYVDEEQIEYVFSNIKKYELDDKSIFEIEGEIPLTRTSLNAKDMLRLLLKGFFYVSDFLDYYSLFMSLEDGDEKAHSIIDEINILKELKQYATPMVRVKIPANVQSAMRSREITTFAQLQEKKQDFPDGVRGYVYELVDDIERLMLKYS